MDSTYTGRTVNKMLMLNSWQIGSGTQTNFTQALQYPIVNARAIHFLSFVMPNFIRPFTTNDNRFWFYYNDVLANVQINTNLFFTTIDGFLTHFNGLFVALAIPLTFTQTLNPVPGGITPFTLTGTVTAGNTWRPVNYDGSIAYEGNFRVGFADKSYTNALSQVASGFPNVILRTNSISVQTNLTGSTHSAGRDFNTTFTVPVAVDPSVMISFNNPYRIEFPTILPSIASVTIKLVDDDGYELNIPTNCYMTCVLAVECDA